MVGTLIWLVGCGSDSAKGESNDDGGSSADAGDSGGQQQDQTAGRSGADGIGGAGGSAAGDGFGGDPADGGTSSGGSGTGGAAVGGAGTGGVAVGGAAAGAEVAVDGCPATLGVGTPFGCNGYVDEACTLQGRTLDFAIGPRRSDDGAIWFGYALRDIDRDVVLHEYCVGTGEPTCYCTEETTTDRTVRNLYLARAATAAADNVEHLLQVPLGNDPNRIARGDVFHLEIRGNRLYLVYEDGIGNPTQFRYLVIDRTRL